MNCYYISKTTHIKKNLCLFVNNCVIKYIFYCFFLKFYNPIFKQLYIISNIIFVLTFLLLYQFYIVTLFFYFSSYKNLSA